MANEELYQRDLLDGGMLKGIPFGKYEDVNIGATNIKTLISVGLFANVPQSIDFPFSAYIPPKNPVASHSVLYPDRLKINSLGKRGEASFVLVSH